MAQATAKAGKYRQLQMACVLATVAHAVAVLLGMYLFREAHLEHFSTVRLMHSVPTLLPLWKANLIFTILSCLSFLLLALAIDGVLEQVSRRLTALAIIFTVIGLAIDLPSLSRLMVYFADISTQLVLGGSFARQQLLLEGWKTINECVTNSLLLANGLYSATGLLLSYAIIAGRGLPRWLGWTSVPIWIAGEIASVLTFRGLVQWALVILLASVIGFILWTIVLGVTIDPSSQAEPTNPAN